LADSIIAIAGGGQPAGFCCEPIMVSRKEARDIFQEFFVGQGCGVMPR
jgi:hypothetical protein